MRVERLLTPFVLLSVTALLVGTTIERSRSFDGTINFLAFFATTAAIYAVFALALNVQWGYTGIFNFGVAAFFLVGAFLMSPNPGHERVRIDRYPVRPQVEQDRHTALERVGILPRKAVNHVEVDG